MSFSARKLETLISKLPHDSIGYDALRYEVIPIINEIVPQAKGDTKKSLAEILKQKVLKICDRYEGDAMPIEDSKRIFTFLSTIVIHTLKFLAGKDENAKEAMRLVSEITKWEI